MAFPRRIAPLACAAFAAGCAYDTHGLTAPSYRESMSSQQPSLSPVGATISVGSTVTLTLNKNGAKGLPLPVTAFWSTTNGGVATVSQAGVVRGVSPGIAVIVAISGSASASTSVTVTK